MEYREKLDEELNLAGMPQTADEFLKIAKYPPIIFASIFALATFLILSSTPIWWFTFIVFFVVGGVTLYLMLHLPKINARIVGSQIEADIFVPSRMIVTLLESGTSILSAFDRVSKTDTVSGNYYGRIASEIYLGKNLQEAINDAMQYTPSRSFKRLLEPIQNSLRTGAAIENNLLSALNDLTDEKIVEIERYEKRLAPVSMFYMIFGVIMPTIAVVALVIMVSIAGITVTFFPFLFLLLMLVIIAQVLFFKLFQSMRPLVKL